jgi:tight adherence protein C
MENLAILGVAIGEALLLSGLLLWRLAPRAETAVGADDAETLPFLTGDFSPLQRQLAQAGFTNPSAVPLFNLSKVVAGALGFAAGYLGLTWFRGDTPEFSTMTIAACTVTFCVGYMLPALWISARQEAYKQRLEKALPDALDLLQICMEAGQSLDQSIIRTARELHPVHPELAAHLDWAAEAILAGMDRGEAFRRIAAETENEDIGALGNALVQTVRMGTPVAQILTVYTDDLRDKRLRKVESKANVLPTKMTLGTMAFTVPPLLLLLLTPAILRIMGMV